MAIEAELRPYFNGAYQTIYPKTSLKMINDMTALIQQFSKSADAATARNVLGIQPFPVKAIGNNTDLNTVTGGGWYLCNANAIAATLKNLPVNVAFFLEVLQTSSQITQRCTPYNNPKALYIRNYVTDTKSWLPWVRLGLPAGGTANDFLRGDGTWQKIQSIIGQGIIAQSLQQNGWVKFANGLIIQWTRDDNHTYIEQDEIKYTFPIPFPNGCVLCGSLGWGKEMYGGNYQGSAVKRWTNTDFTYIGGDNGGSYMMVLALGY